MSGVPTMGKRSFGFEQLSGLSLVANPPARISPFTALTRLPARWNREENAVIAFTRQRPRLVFANQRLEEKDTRTRSGGDLQQGPCKAAPGVVDRTVGDCYRMHALDHSSSRRVCQTVFDLNRKFLFLIARIIDGINPRD